MDLCVLGQYIGQIDDVSLLVNRGISGEIKKCEGGKFTWTRWHCVMESADIMEVSIWTDRYGQKETILLYGHQDLMIGDLRVPQSMQHWVLVGAGVH